MANNKKAEDNFANKIAQRESSGDYSAVNRLGYLGKYQFGGLALQDLGFQDDKGEWTGKDGVTSKEDFLKNEKIQEKAFQEWTPKLKRYLKSNGADKYIGKKINDLEITEKGLLAASHLVGASAVNKMLTTGEIPVDANGTKATDYIAMFQEPKVKTLEEQSAGILKRPLPQDFLKQLTEDIFNYKVTKIPEAPNTIHEASLLNKSINKGAPVSQESLDRIKKFSKNKQGDFGGASPIQKGGLIRSVERLGGDFSKYVYENVKEIPNIEQEDILGVAKNFTEHIVEDSMIGLGVQRVLKGAMTSDRVDPNFDPTQDEYYDYYTKELDHEDFKSLIEDYSWNKDDFHMVGDMLIARNKRLKEMEVYSKENPVVSGSAFLASMMVDAAFFMPVTAVIAAQGAATLTNVGFKSIKSAKKLGWIVAAEAIEQGGQELAWSVYKKDYEFSPALFLAGMSVGVGVRGVIDGLANSRALKEIIANEDGFIQMSSAQARKLIKEVAKETDNMQAKQLAGRISEVKLNKSKSIREDLLHDYDIFQESIEGAKIALKNAVKGSSEARQAKGLLQKLTRKLAKHEVQMELEIKRLIDGSHPELKTAMNPEFDLKHIADELGIDYSSIDTPAKQREFLGLTNSEFADDLIFDGEKGYTSFVKKQTEELKVNKRLDANYYARKVSDVMDTTPLDIKEGLGQHIAYGLRNPIKTSKRLVDKTFSAIADPERITTQYVFNKGNQVNRKNHLTAAFYNGMGSDIGGRQFGSKMRMLDYKSMFEDIYNGLLMNNYHDKGDEIMRHLYKDTNTLERVIRSKFTGEFEDIVEPIFNNRINKDISDAEFRAMYPDPVIQEISDRYAKEWDQMNDRVAKDAIAKKVANVGPSSRGFMHRAISSPKARLIEKADLEEGVYLGMKAKLELNGVEFNESFLRTQAKNYTYGIQHKDITKNMEATSNYLDFLKKFQKTAEGKSNAEVIEAVSDAIKKAEAQKVANELGELGKRADIDFNVVIPNTKGQKLSSILESNHVVVQSRYNSRMAARTGAAEMGIKDINDLDELVLDAIDYEGVRLFKDPKSKEKVKYLEDIMQQDLKSYKYGGLGGQGDVTEVEANDALRFLSKVTTVNLMNHVGIASIGELAGTITEVGVYNTTKAYMNPIKKMLRKMHLTGNTAENIATLSDDLTALTGIGKNDYAFTTKGVSRAEQIYPTGSGIMSNIEAGIDAMGRVTQGTFGPLETMNRMVTAESLGIHWARHYMEGDPKGFINKLLYRKTTNRTLENLELGKWVKEDGVDVFKTNEMYDLVGEQFRKHVTYNDKGTAIAMNFEKWDASARESFRNTIRWQASKIFIDTDSTTSSLFMNTPLGRILKQFARYSVNAVSKVAGFAVGNALNGIQHRDAAELLKFGNKMFWATAMGTLSVGLRDELVHAGDGTGSEIVKSFDTPLRTIAIGFSRSGMVGNLDTINSFGSALFDYDNIFNRSSFTGRDKNFLNIMNTPIGQLGTNTFEGAKRALQGDFKGALDSASRVTPVKRQLGIQQIINYMNRD